MAMWDGPCGMDGIARNDENQKTGLEPGGPKSPDAGKSGSLKKPIITAPAGTRPETRKRLITFFKIPESTRIDSLKLCETEHFLNWGYSRRFKIRPYYPQWGVRYGAPLEDCDCRSPHT